MMTTALRVKWHAISSTEPGRNATGSGIIKNLRDNQKPASGFLKCMLDRLQTEHALWVV